MDSTKWPDDITRWPVNKCLTNNFFLIRVLLYLNFINLDLWKANSSYGHIEQKKRAHVLRNNRKTLLHRHSRRMRYNNVGALHSNERLFPRESALVLTSRLHARCLRNDRVFAPEKPGSGVPLVHVFIYTCWLSSIDFDYFISNIHFEGSRKASWLFKSGHSLYWIGYDWKFGLVYIFTLSSRCNFFLVIFCFLNNFDHLFIKIKRLALLEVNLAFLRVYLLKLF